MKPSAKLFVHTINTYTPTYTKDNSGGRVETFSSLSTDAKAMVQPAVSKVVDLYQRMNEEVTHSIFIESMTVYDLLSIDDLIVFDSRNFRIKGRRDSIEFGRVFRVDVQEFYGDVTIGS